MHQRFATLGDCQLLGELNYQLIQDEGHRNPMTVQELVNRMREWLETDYRASVFEDDSGILAYALYREDKDRLYLRQFFVRRHKRRTGIGRQCLGLLLSEIWPSAPSQ
jgi:GNAT superfamily N-acetyltransferase